MSEKPSKFEIGFSELTKRVGSWFESTDIATESVTRKLRCFDFGERTMCQSDLLAKLVSQFLIVYFASGWARFERDQETWDKIKSIVDLSVIDFMDIIPFNDKTTIVTAEALAHVAASKASQKNIDVTQWIVRHTAKPTQKHLGIFFTPPALADYIIARVNESFTSLTGSGTLIDQMLCQSREHESAILDPALGSGEFILSLLRRANRVSKEIGLTKHQRSNLLLHTLEHCWGYEIHPVAILSAHFRLLNFLADKLDTGRITKRFRFRWQSTFDLLHGNSEFGNAKILTIIGNPPFGALTKSVGTPIARLLRGQLNEDVQSRTENWSSDNIRSNETANYFVDEQGSINERKTWIYDLYVQFFRLAQHLISQRDAGLLGFVTNRGFVDNVTFRGMRYQLSRSFSEIEITDLGGDRRSAKKQNDANAFDIETPVAVSIMSAIRQEHTKISYWKPEGSFDDKFNQLKNAENNFQSFAITTIDVPNGRPFSARLVDQGKNKSSWRLDRVMPQRGSPIITARDSLVVGFDGPDVGKKIAEFCNPEIKDDQLREKYFSRARSTRYLAGDTRGWSLSKARKGLANRTFEIEIRKCSYRPFDQRFIAWSSGMIDWPRHELMSCLCEPGNFGLVTRRQSPPELPWNYAWVSGGLTVDGIIRSDNRGNESIFPIWHQDSLNFSNDFIEFLESIWGIKIRRTKNSECNSPDGFIGGEELGSYIYALMNSSQYRRKLDGQLQTGWPPVVVFKEWNLAKQIVSVGKRLLCLHLAPLKESPIIENNRRLIGQNGSHGKLSYDGQTISFGKNKFATGIPPEVWNYKIGTYQVVRKWIKDRRNTRHLSEHKGQFNNLIRRISHSLRLTNELDFYIERSGNWNSIIAT